MDRNDLLRKHKDLVKVVVSPEAIKIWRETVGNLAGRKPSIIMQVAAKAMEFAQPFTYQDLLEKCNFTSKNTVHKYFYTWRSKGYFLDKGIEKKPRQVPCPSCGDRISLGSVLGSISTKRKIETIAQARQKYQETCRTLGGKKAILVWATIKRLAGQQFTAAEIKSLCKDVGLSTVRQLCYQWRNEGKLQQVRFSVYREDRDRILCKNSDKN